MRRGSLLPLYPTLGGQLYAIAREYGLPSIGGLSLFLCDDGEGNAGPRIGDDAWAAIWGRYFEEGAEESFEEVSRRSSHSRHGRVPSGHSSISPRTISRSGEGYASATDSEELSARRSTSGSRLRASIGGEGGSSRRHSPMHDTSSRMGDSFGSRTGGGYSSRASTPFGRLPIVGRIEWAVERHRAPWWGAWLGEPTEQVSSPARSVSSHAGQSRAGRRSIHLAVHASPRSAPSTTRGLSSPPPALPSSALDRGAPTRSSLASVVDFGPDADREAVAYVPAGLAAAVVSASGLPTADGRADAESSISGQSFSLPDSEHHAPQSAALPQEGCATLPDDIADSESDFVSSERGLPAIAHDAPHAQFADPSPARTAKPASVGAAAFETSDDRAPPTSRTGQSPETHSYAGYSALIEDAESKEATSAPSDAETPALRFSAAEARQSLATQPAFQMMGETDEDMWAEMHEQRHELAPSGSGSVLHNADAPSHRSAGALSPHSLSLHTNAEREREAAAAARARTSPSPTRGSAVHDWIAKTSQSPLMRRRSQLAGFGLDDETVRHGLPGDEESQAGFAEEDAQLLPPENDVRDVVALWASTVASGDMPPPSLPPSTAPSVSEAVEVDTANLVAATPKQSLLSPIALGDSPMFAGPRPSLGGLGGTRTPPLPSVDPSFTGSSFAESRSRDAPHLSLSSPSFLVANTNSPGGRSGKSNSTDLSDTLMDMERALELLSPVASAGPHSPAFATALREDGGRRSLSSRDSFHKARTLSTSVTPSPRWLARNGRAPNTVPYSPAGFSSGTSPRPASASAAQDLRAPRPSDLRVPASASRLARRIAPASHSGERRVPSPLDEDATMLMRSDSGSEQMEHESSQHLSVPSSPDNEETRRESRIAAERSLTGDVTPELHPTPAVAETLVATSAGSVANEALYVALPPSPLSNPASMSRRSPSPLNEPRSAAVHVADYARSNPRQSIALSKVHSEASEAAPAPASPESHPAVTIFDSPRSDAELPPAPLHSIAPLTPLNEASAPASARHSVSSHSERATAVDSPSAERSVERGRASTVASSPPFSAVDEHEMRASSSRHSDKTSFSETSGQSPLLAQDDDESQHDVTAKFAQLADYADADDVAQHSDMPLAHAEGSYSPLSAASAELRSEPEGGMYVYTKSTSPRVERFTQTSFSSGIDLDDDVLDGNELADLAEEPEDEHDAFAATRSREDSLQSSASSSVVDGPTSVRRLIRGESFAASSEGQKSSDTPSSNMTPISENESVNPMDETAIQISPLIAQDADSLTVDPRRPSVATTAQEGDETATYGARSTQGHSTERASSTSESGDDWSQDGSARGGTDAGERTGTQRFSDRFSQNLGHPGLHTPTFLYDTHLEDASRPTSHTPSSRHDSLAPPARRGSSARALSNLSSLDEAHRDAWPNSADPALTHSEPRSDDNAPAQIAAPLQVREASHSESVDALGVSGLGPAPTSRIEQPGLTVDDHSADEMERPQLPASMSHYALDGDDSASSNGDEGSFDGRLDELLNNVQDFSALPSSSGVLPSRSPDASALPSSNDYALSSPKLRTMQVSTEAAVRQALGAWDAERPASLSSGLPSAPSTPGAHAFSGSPGARSGGRRVSASSTHSHRSGSPRPLRRSPGGSERGSGAHSPPLRSAQSPNGRFGALPPSPSILPQFAHGGANSPSSSPLATSFAGSGSFERVHGSGPNSPVAARTPPMPHGAQMLHHQQAASPAFPHSSAAHYNDLSDYA
jgi:hypothetical protein